MRITRAGRGSIKRISAAVVVNHQSTVERGKTVTKALSAEQLERMTALVRESIGFSQERGDSVNLMNAPFQVESVPVEQAPLWRQPETLDLARSLAWPVGLFLFGALVLLGLVRPAMRTLASTAPATARGNLDALEAEVPQRPALPPPARNAAPAAPTEEQLRLEDARALTRENPVAVANIIKNWVNGDHA